MIRLAGSVAWPCRHRWPQCLLPSPAAAEGRVAPAAVRAAPGVEDRGLALPHLEGALRFATHDDHKIRILAGLYAKALVRDDEGRAGQYDVADALDRLVREGNAVEGGFGACNVSRTWFASVPLMPATARGGGFGSKLAVAVAIHRDDAPSYTLVAVGEGGENVGA